MHFDHTKKIYGFKKKGSRSGTGQPSGAQPEEVGGRQRNVPASHQDNGHVIIRVGDKQSFENLVRDQLHLHEVIAAASATPISGTPAAMADVLAAVELEETFAEVEAAFELMDDDQKRTVLRSNMGLKIESSAMNDADEAVPIVASEDSVVVVAKGNLTSDSVVGRDVPPDRDNNNNAFASEKMTEYDDTEDFDDDVSSERDTLKPPRPVESIEIKMLQGSEAPQPRDDDELEMTELSDEELIEITETSASRRAHPDSDHAIVVSASTESMRSSRISENSFDSDRSTHSNRDMSALPSDKSAMIPQPRHAVAFQPHSRAGLRAFDDELQIVRTSVPPPPEASAQRTTRNPWKIVAMVALFLLAILLGWNLNDQQRNFFSGSFADLNPFAASTDAPSLVVTQPHATARHADTVAMNADDAVAVAISLSDKRADLSADDEMENEPLEKGAVAADAKSDRRTENSDDDSPIDRQWRRTDVENPRRLNQREVAEKPLASSEGSEADLQREMLDTKATGRLDKTNKTSVTATEDAESADDENSAAAEAGTAPGEPTVSSAVPETPSREAVRKAMQAVRPVIESCRADTSGKLILKMIVSGSSGKIVSSEVIDDTFRGTSTGRCAVEAIQRARLPMFQKDYMIIKYPFNL